MDTASAPDQATTLIDSGAPLSEIARACPSQMHAYKLFARTMQERYALSGAGSSDRCTVCELASTAVTRRITWRAICHDTKTTAISVVFLLLGRLTTSRVEIQFATHHACCQSCARGLWLRSTVSSLAKHLFFALLFLYALGSLGFLFIGVLLFSPGGLPSLAPVVGFFLGYPLIGVLLFYLHRWLWKASVPPTLRFLARYPFEPHTVGKA